MASGTADPGNGHLRPGEQVARHTRSLMHQIVTSDLEDVAQVWQDHEAHCRDCMQGWCCEVEQALVNRMNFDLSLKDS